MSKKKKGFLIVIFIILDICLIIGLLVIKDATMANDLEKEAKLLEEYSFTRDNYKTKIKTRGSYSEVEKAMKNYLDEYATSLQEVLQIARDDKITKVLSYDNYKNDGKEFKKSLKYLEDTENKYNENMKKLNTMLSDEDIINYGEKNIVGSNYLDLYKKYMLSDEMKKNYEDSKKLVGEIGPKIGNVLKTSKEVLNFLVKNEKSWKLEDNEIKFKTKDLYDEYTKLIKKLN